MRDGITGGPGLELPVGHMQWECKGSLGSLGLELSHTGGSRRSLGPLGLELSYPTGDAGVRDVKHNQKT